MSANTKKVYVLVTDDNSDEVVKRFGPMTELKADKVVSGLYRQINLEQYTISIEIEREKSNG